MRWSIRLVEHASATAPEGEASLVAQRAAVDAVFSGLAPRVGCYEGVPAPIVRNGCLKLALRLRPKHGAFDEAPVNAIVAAFDPAAPTRGELGSNLNAAAADSRKV
jgi:hypothetical protein